MSELAQEAAEAALSGNQQRRRSESAVGPVQKNALMETSVTELRSELEHQIASLKPRP